MQEESYTSELTCPAHVELLADGRLRPTGSSGTPFVEGAAGAVLARTLAQQLAAPGGRTKGVPELVDGFSFRVHGHLAGGIMCGLLVHPVIGRAAFVAGTSGLKGLCRLGGSA
jgi:hypothetical protein